MTSRMKTIIGNVLLAIGSLAGIFTLVLVADRALGHFRPADELPAGLMFAPHSAAYYDTIEFKCTVYANNLGFRGDDTTRVKTRRLHVLALGDSYTYGWGVDLADTWVKRIEKSLRAEGRDIEILNLGVPGHGPGQYAAGKCFYDYDTHFTPEGNRLFADLLAPTLKPYLN